MGTFMIAYSIVWLALVAYVARLGIGQHRLMRDADLLRSRIARCEHGLARHADKPA